ncbi:hypothetical protein QBC34DRAFT_119736 [Podospora aff. communis PSN243]|uniref:Uncharacterized protein n=1 Tax=Podospora aff. communis PSN243 TaxID=3040156 RepID=A0AAV9GL89_9PEZI|nr:hypothetical protein QBC34DRAFT_119736 [Podospora aff. communis PSN243]
MESSPLTKAHDHARAASNATQLSDTTTAVTEHALAAGEFANAAKSTGSIEALRTLRLLEQHHKRLAELLKLPVDPPGQQSTTDSDIPEEDEKDASAEQDGATKTAKVSSRGASSTAAAAPVKPVPTLPQQRRYPGRELSSSIASNLASARGIKSKYRGQPLAPSISNDQAPGSLEARPRREGSLRNKATDGADGRKPSWVPPAPQGIKEDVASGEPSPTAAPGDEGFSRFYSTFGSLINKLSAPLAFAGLPLIAEESTASEAAPVSPSEQATQRKPRQQRPPPPTSEPELSKIFSRATLQAIRGPGHHGGDSFYFVPTSGHTASYASILNHENKEKRRIAASQHDADLGDDQDEDDFVDARESQPTTGVRKRVGKTQTERGLQNMVEELHTENVSLKEMIDKLSKRLHAFELNSQSAHLALAQSVRLQRPGSPMSSSGGPGDEALKRRNRELEEQLALTMQKMETMEKDFNKLQQNLEKYRERWAALKASAKAKMGARSTAGEGEPSTPSH